MTTALRSEADDGRTRRRTRNRDAVVDALLSLFDEGELAPSAEAVATRAGLSPRSVFRYFDDADDLTHAAIARQRERLAPLYELDIDRSLPLADRIEAFVAGRIRLLEAMGTVGRVARLRGANHPELASELRRIRAALRRQMRAALGDGFDALGPARSSVVVAAADVACSYEAYDLLRNDQRLSRAKAAAVLVATLTALLVEGSD